MPSLRNFLIASIQKYGSFRDETESHTRYLAEQPLQTYIRNRMKEEHRFHLRIQRDMNARNKTLVSL